MFELTFLGTSAGMPTKHRNVSGLAVECVNPYLGGDKQRSQKNRPWVLIDCGEGTQHQLLHTALSVRKLSVICITHVHGDHCYGLPGLLASMAMHGRTEPLILIAPKPIGKLLDTVSLTTELYFPFAVKFVAIEDLLASGGPYQIEFSPNHHLAIDITELSHRTSSYAFSLTQTLKRRKLDTQKLIEAGVPAGKVWGQLQRGENVSLDDGQVLTSDDFVNIQQTRCKLVVAGDNDTPDLLTDTVQAATALVHEATFTHDVLEKILAKPDGFNPQHTTAKQIAEFAENTQLPTLILTHFSARYQPFDYETAGVANMADIRREAEKSYHGNLILAKDLMRIRVNEEETSILYQPE